MSNAIDISNYQQPNNLKKEYYEMIIKFFETLNEFVGHTFVNLNFNDKFPGSIACAQLCNNDGTELYDAYFDIFPSGYLYTRINGVFMTWSSHKEFLKFMKS